MSERRLISITNEQREAIDQAMKETRGDLKKEIGPRKPLTDSDIALVRASIGLHNTFMEIFDKQRDHFKK